ncbi:MAG TPA: hypothetical protein VG722_06995, partial [Tepidisphaeraceae bacterium]|nr:hypothetical protein [Tepidisphaeraceae bacterium]
MVCTLISRPSAAQIPPNLGKGFRILLQQGLQIQAMVTPYPDELNLDLWKQSNFTSIQWQWNATDLSLMGPAPGLPWGEWVKFDYSQPTAAELPYASNLISLQCYDELDLTNPTNIQNLAGWFAAARPNFPNTLLFTNEEAYADAPTDIAAYMAAAQPDMLMYDSYPVSTSFHIIGGSLNSLYADMAKMRTMGLAGNDGTGANPIPVGHWFQTFSDFRLWPRFPSESEIRAQEFAGWTFGEKFESAFVYDNAAPGNNIYSELFNGYGDSSPTPAFNQIAETNRLSLNLGPALVRLLTTKVAYVSGMHKTSTGATAVNQVPAGMQTWVSSRGDPYLTSISAQNLGTLNNGLPGDVLLGWFKVLDESFDGPDYQNQFYFMVTNGLTDANGSAADCRQQITMQWYFGNSGITQLQELDPNTGQVTVVPLTHISGATWQLTITLDGGTGALFKFDTGAPFVGFYNVPE